jgi:transposase-like protein
MLQDESETLAMTEIVCPRCSYKEVAMVKKEMQGDGGYRRHFRCPRCSNTWEKKD